MEDAFDGGQVRQEPHDDGEEWHIGLLDQAQSPLGSSLDHRQGPAARCGAIRALMPPSTVSGHRRAARPASV
jgi:hypothetical protein